MRGNRAGFTLIELMISVALLAIMLGVSTSFLMEFGAHQRQLEYSNSLEQAPAQLQQLRDIPFGSLPPQVLKVSQGGMVKLPPYRILASSLKVKEADSGKVIDSAKFVPDKNAVSLSGVAVGKKVVVDYEFVVPHREQAFFVSPQGEVVIDGVGEVEIVGARVAAGNRLTPLTEFKLAGRRLQVSSKLAGKLVVLEYLDQSCNRVGGKFLSQDLQISKGPTKTRLLEVSEPFEGGWRMRLPILREAP